MSTAHLLWLATGSTESPMILTLRLSNSGLRRAMVPSSVVQTGVKSFGWENSAAHEKNFKIARRNVVPLCRRGADVQAIEPAGAHVRPTCRCILIAGSYVAF